MKRSGLFLTFFILICGLSQAQKASSPLLDHLTRSAYQRYLSDPDTAIMLTHAALDGAIKVKDKYVEAYAYFLFSKCYWVKANYKLSTEYGFKALKLFRSTPHYGELDATLLAVGRTLMELGNVQKARAFIKEALQSGIRRSDTLIQAAAYREYSFLLTELEKFDSALYYSDKGISMFEKLNDTLEISVLYGRKSRIFFQQQKFLESKRFAYQGLLFDSLVNNRRGLAISYFQVAQNENALGNRMKAIEMLKESIRINAAIGNLNWEIRAHEFLSDLYLQAGRPTLAAAELQKVSRSKDELYNSEKHGQIQEMQSLHELEAKESTIKLLEQENALKKQQVKTQRLFVAFLLVTVLFLVLLIFMLTRLRNIQKKTNRNLANQNMAIEQQKIAIQTQAEHLRQLDQVKTKLFSVISHDLRGPISNLQSLLDLFTKKLMTAEEFVALSERLKENLNLTQRTLENLLNWSLSQMGGIKTERRKIEVTASIDEACRLMEHIAARKNISLTKDFLGPMKVWADEDQLQVVLRNLIHNAIKFSSFNDTIRIRAFKDDHHCHITVRDNGIGMSHEEIQTVVGSREYFSKAGTEQEKGTGLGLLLCKEFITRNGGQFTLSSAVGEGTEIAFTLRLAEPETRPQLALQ